MLLIPLVLFAGLVVFLTIKIVPQSDAYVVERLGKYSKTINAGVHFLIPFIDNVRARVSLKEQVEDFAPQPVITKDNVSINIDSVVFFRVSDPKLYCYGVDDPIDAIENLTATTLRNIVGTMDLDEALTSRDIINSKMTIILDEVTDPWGIKVTRVELKSIDPPKEIKMAMEKQMKAEREKREILLRSEGEKQSKILIAEGEKEAAILNAEAAKSVAILHAEAERESAIKIAEGQAQSIRNIKEAEADGIRMLKEAAADKSVLTLKALESYIKMADGKATKIIIPNDLSNITSLASAITAAVKEQQDKK